MGMEPTHRGGQLRHDVRPHCRISLWNFDRQFALFFSPEYVRNEKPARRQAA